MFTLKNLFARALLALMLATGAGTAAAGPIYHVTLDTAGLSGDGVLEFVFSGDATTAGPATAFLSNFRGSYGSGSVGGEASGGVESNLLLGNAGGYAELLQMVNLGGIFAFDVRFELAPEGDGTTLGISLYDADFSGYLGIDGPLVRFELMPGSAIGVSADNALATIETVSEVPEPAALALLVLGLGLMASTARARRMR